MKWIVYIWWSGGGMFNEMEGGIIFGVVERVCRVQKGLRSEDL